MKKARIHIELGLLTLFDFLSAVQTATRSDNDLVMKVGINYPFGPFEWGYKIGIAHVYYLLAVVHAANQDDRYLSCPLLKTRGKSIAKQP